MFEDRTLKVDLIALGLLVVTLFLGVSLLTYAPEDPPAALVYPQPDRPHNACGPAGALAAHGMFQLFGLGAYYLLVSLVIVDASIFRHGAITDVPLRATGWMLSLVGVSTLAAMAAGGWSPGPVIGAGGYLGALGWGVLHHHVATTGATILIISLIASGLLLATDYTLVKLVAWLVSSLGGVVASIFTRSRKASAAQPAPASDGPTIRIAGRRVDATADDEWDEDEEEEDEDEEYDYEEEDEEDEEDEEEDDEAAEAPSEVAEEPVAAEKPPTVAARLASALRIKAPKRNEETEAVIEELEAASREEDPGDYEVPSTEMLLPAESVSLEAQERDIRRKAKILERTFSDFGFNVKVVEIETGPVIAQFEVELEAGLRLSKITGLADDLAIALRVPSVRIVAPIPGKNTVGVEVPNAERHLVRLREVIEKTNGKAKRMRLPLFFGKDVAGNPMVADLASLPHLLIAGRTGTGKSVCLNTIIMSLLMTRRPDEVKMLLIDPKMVELSPYMRLPHLMHPVVTDMKKAEAILGWAVEKMDERYALLARAGVRNLAGYNQLGEEELMKRLQPETEEEAASIPLQLPSIVIVADEMADLMMTAAKEVETHIIRLAQKSRAVGIHLVLATQKPTVDVITGLIKSNLPARISFQVASRTDSRVVLDEMGADKLLGNGDMLFLWPGTSTLLRGQGAYVTDDEINAVVAAVGTTEPQFAKELVQLPAAGAQGDGAATARRNDELYDSAVEVVIGEGRGSVSLLQRALGIGYGRAARLIDYMAEDGVVGEYAGSQAREVMVTAEQWAAMRSGEEVPAATPALTVSSSPPPRSAKPAVPSPSRASRGKPPWKEEADEAEDETDSDDASLDDDAYTDEEYADEEEDLWEDEGDDESDELDDTADDDVADDEYEEDGEEEEEYEEDEYEDEEYEEEDYEEDEYDDEEGAGDDTSDEDETDEEGEYEDDEYDEEEEAAEEDEYEDDYEEEAAEDDAPKPRPRRRSA
ncbi:MAG: DNA translocase FtsK [Planctomycetales bacterium]|nr:DNA translocase FtsK [Planctomycetales bacterium]